MPFTFTHPIAVLPLKKIAPDFILPGLIIGAIAPDFGYYFPLPEVLSVESHTFKGLFLHSLPIGLVLFFIYYQLCETFLFFIPDPHRSLLLEARSSERLNIRFIALLLISILLGACTHNIWDAFTHKYGWFVLRSSLLNRELSSITGSKYYLYNLLQHLSTFLGTAYLVYAYQKWLGKRDERESFSSWRYKFWLGLFAVSILISMTISLPGTELTFFGMRKLAFVLAVRSVQVFCCLLLPVLMVKKIPALSGK